MNGSEQEKCKKSAKKLWITFFALFLRVDEQMKDIPSFYIFLAEKWDKTRIIVR